MANASQQKSLVIVESPAKARTINKYLGKNYVVKASLGHVQDLPKKDLAVDVENGFEPTYTVIDGKKSLIDELRRTAKKSEAVYLAADPDREGEAICYHLAEVLQGKRNQTLKIYRVLFNEITKKSIQKAFEAPGTIDVNLVDAQQARRVLDRLVGYKISPLLWDKVRRGLSAGRVQTVALRLVVDREKEIKAFEKKEYWTLDARLKASSPPQLKARLTRRNKETFEINDEATSKALVAVLEGAPFKVENVTTQGKEAQPSRSVHHLDPASRKSPAKIRFSVKRTMLLAQRLYEGIELGDEGAVGLITYMRTDSPRVSNDAVAECRAFVEERYGAEYLPETPNVYKSRKKAQDAHEAIRPTSVARTPEFLKKHLGDDELKVYTIIWKRFVASQMKPALFDQTSVEVTANGRRRQCLHAALNRLGSEVRRVPESL